jgi:hypothetical protein
MNDVTPGESKTAKKEMNWPRKFYSWKKTPLAIFTEKDYNDNDYDINIIYNTTYQHFRPIHNEIFIFHCGPLSENLVHPSYVI